MTEPIQPIPLRQFLESEGLEDWRVVSDGICAFFRADSLQAGARLAEAIAGIEGIDRHSVGVDLRRDGATVRLITVTADYFGPSSRDVELAREISAIARRLGLGADPTRLQSVLIVVGARDVAAVMPFWQAVLGYDRRPDTPDEDLVDPRERGPAFWFETMDEPRSAERGGAIHVAVWLPPEEPRRRLDQALAAGGHLVRDEYAPSWWTLADTSGNEADISTIEQRD